MQLRHVAVLQFLTALVITSSATAAVAAQGEIPFNLTSSSQHSSHGHVDREGDINVSVAGNVTPGNGVTITATRNGQPVRFSLVTVNGDAVGQTDANGSITVQVPDADELEIKVTTDDREAELTVDFEDAEDDEHDSDDDEEGADGEDEQDGYDEG